MKQTINFSQFCDSFGGDYKNNFSYEGKKAIFEYLENYEEQTGEEIELDIIAICCDYTEYEDLKELQNNYTDIETMEELEEQTQVIPIYNLTSDGKKSERFIIQDY